MEPADPATTSHPMVAAVAAVAAAIDEAFGVAERTQDTAVTAAVTARLVGLQDRLADALAQDRHTPVRDALAAGQLRAEQALVFVTAVDALPDTLDPDVLAKAEAYLVEQAAVFDATRLRVLGDKLLEVVAPEVAEEVEANRLADRERRAAQATRLTMSSDGQGSVFVRATIPDLHAARLQKLLSAYAAPRHQAATAAQAGQPTPERRPSPQRLGLPVP